MITTMDVRNVIDGHGKLAEIQNNKICIKSMYKNKRLPYEDFLGKFSFHNKNTIPWTWFPIAI